MVDRISVNITDVSCRSGNVSKTDGGVKAVTDDFRKLLQGQDQKTDNKEVSKKDKKTGEKPEKPADRKEVKDTKDSGEDNVKEETAQEKTSQTDGLLAAYQMNLGLRPEVIQAEPEAVEELIVPGFQPETVSEIASGTAQVQVSELQPEIQSEAVPVIQVGQNTKAEEIKQPETVDISKAGQKVTDPDKNADSSGAKENNNAQTENHPAEQIAQALTPQVQPEVQDVKAQEPVRMYASQPEALPEKVTDQLLAKMSEGVQEFEIHIEPANLGKIAVKILYQEGQATVSIFCSEKRALDVLGRNAGEIGQVIEKNLGGTTTIIVDKQENDYLNQQKDENQQNGQNADKEQQKDGKKEQNAEDAEQFLQKLRLGLAG